MDIALKNPSELVGRIGLAPHASLLLIDVPEPLERLLAASRSADAPLESIPESRLRSVKTEFDAVLLWRESRVGSREVLAATLKRLGPAGVLWVVTALRKVSGPRTPAAHRLDLADLEKAFASHGLRRDAEVRFSAWHVGYRFARAPEGGRGYST